MENVIAIECRNKAYREIIGEGLDGKQRRRIFSNVFFQEACRTTAEIARDTGMSQRSTCAARINELIDMDVLERHGKRICTVTGRTASRIRATGRSPRKLRLVEVTCPHCHGSGKVLAKATTPWAGAEKWAKARPRLPQKSTGTAFAPPRSSSQLDLGFPS